MIEDHNKHCEASHQVDLAGYDAVRRLCSQLEQEEAMHAAQPSQAHSAGNADGDGDGDDEDSTSYSFISQSRGTICCQLCVLSGDLFFDHMMILCCLQARGSRLHPLCPRDRCRDWADPAVIRTIPTSRCPMTSRRTRTCCRRPLLQHHRRRHHHHHPLCRCLHGARQFRRCPLVPPPPAACALTTTSACCLLRRSLVSWTCSTLPVRCCYCSVLFVFVLTWSPDFRFVPRFRTLCSEAMFLPSPLRLKNRCLFSSGTAPFV